MKQYYIISLEEYARQLDKTADQDKALMSRCLTGLIKYGAKLSHDPQNETKLTDLRNEIGIIASYWGLDGGSEAILRDHYLLAFDQAVALAQEDVQCLAITEHDGAMITKGLHRYAMEMIYAQGSDAKEEIAQTVSRMMEIASDLHYSPENTLRMAGEVESMFSRITQSGPQLNL